ncbi:MAG TPA: hypothetical protein VF092_08840 [Longimicrobium sp.]
MKYVFTLVHGTFAQDAGWTKKGSRLRETLRQAFPDCEVAFAPFGWSGRNRPSARIAAAKELREHILKKAQEHPGATQYLVAHSHGGNVSIRALADPAVAACVEGLACLSTPFLHLQPRHLDPDFKAALKGMAAALVAFVAVCLAVTPVFVAAKLWGQDITSYRVAGSALMLAAVLLVVALLAAPRVFLNAGQGLLDSWLNRAKQNYERVRLPPILKPLLIIRTTGDEASAALSTSHLLAFAISHAIIGIASGPAARFQRLLGWRTRPTTLREWLACAAALLVAVPVLPVFLLLTLVLGVLVLLSVGMLSIVLLTFGRSFGITNMFLEVSAEPTPPGSWPVHLFSTRDAWPYMGDERRRALATLAWAGVNRRAISEAPVTRLAHSAPYEHPGALALLADWVSESGSAPPRKVSTPRPASATLPAALAYSPPLAADGDSAGLPAAT